MKSMVYIPDLGHHKHTTIYLYDKITRNLPAFLSPYFSPTTPVNTTNLIIISSILCIHILIPTQLDTNNTTQINTSSPIYTLLYSFLLNAYNQYTYFMHPHIHPHMHLQYLRLHTLPLFIYESICIRMNDYMHPHFFTRESKSSGCLWESYNT